MTPQHRVSYHQLSGTAVRTSTEATDSKLSEHPIRSPVNEKMSTESSIEVTTDSKIIFEIQLSSSGDLYHITTYSIVS